MKTNEFISELRAAPQNRLLFIDANGNQVHAGYHLTELKSALVDTVDCGERVNHWLETIVQLWVPANPAGDYMTCTKFLEIFDQVRGMIPLAVDAEIRVEYGDENFFPSTYHVPSVTRDQNTTRVLLAPPQATCKARDRRVAASSATDLQPCCAPATESCCVP
jgi:hypothetical protein